MNCAESSLLVLENLYQTLMSKSQHPRDVCFVLKRCLTSNPRGRISMFDGTSSKKNVGWNQCTKLRAEYILGPCLGGFFVEGFPCAEPESEP